MAVNSGGILRLRPLINKEATFNRKCSIHKNSYLNMYCINCNDEPLCQKCCNNATTLTRSKHLGHHIIQVTKCTRMNSVKVREIAAHVDVSDLLLQLVKNGVQVAMVLARGKPGDRRHVGQRKHCSNCGFALHPTTHQPGAKYCSVQCKVSFCGGEQRPRHRRKGYPHRAPFY